MSAPVIDSSTEVDPNAPVVPPVVEGELGDAGKKAIDAMKAERNAERDRRKALETELAALKAPKPPAADDKGAPDLDAMRKQLRDEIAAETVNDKALETLESRAEKLFANPEDARAFLASKVGDFVDGGKVDKSAIDEALADLLKKRPYLGIAQSGAERFEGSVDGGTKGTPGKPQMTITEADALYKAGKYEEVEAARKDGRLNKVLGIK